MPYLKSPKNQNRRAALGRPAMKLLGGGGGRLFGLHGRFLAHKCIILET